MKRSCGLVLVEILGLLFLVVVDSSLYSSTVAFVNTITKRYYQHDSGWERLRRLYFESVTSSNNLVRLQQRFNLTEDWMKRKSSIKLNNLNHSIILSRIDWLKERLNLNEDQVGTIIKKAPQLLSCHSVENLGLTLDYLADHIMLNPNELFTLTQKYPTILGSPVARIEQNYNWFEKRLFANKKINKSPRQKKNVLKKLICNSAALFCLDIHTNLDPKWYIIQERLNLNETQLAKIVIRAPNLLSRNFTTSIEPKLIWLQNRLNLNSKQVGKIIIKHPTIINLNVEETFESRLSWLKTRLLLDESIIKKIIFIQPGIIYYSTKNNMEPTLQWLEERLALVDSCQIGRIIEQYPSLLSMSIDNNLEPTFHFYCDCIGEEEAIMLLRKRPLILGASLEKRLKPRREQAQKAGIIIDAKCISRMAQDSDQRWNMSLHY